VDIAEADDLVFDRLIELGALDAERTDSGGLAALMPDAVSREHLARVLGIAHVQVSPAPGRDAGSVWILRTRPIQLGAVRIVPAEAAAQPDDVRLSDSGAFGTGLHPTTSLCLEMLQDIMGSGRPSSLLDVGTGSGVLALAALRLGVPHVTGIDLEPDALRVAEGNARLNGLHDRLSLSHAEPHRVSGSWPVIVANVLAAPLIEMAPALVRLLAHRGTLVLSGIPSGVESDVERAYRRLGLSHRRTNSRAGWVALEMGASW
jgi:ribosomal protein L11 methyltransferase